MPRITRGQTFKLTPERVKELFASTGVYPEFYEEMRCAIVAVLDGTTKTIQLKTCIDPAVDDLVLSLLCHLPTLQSVDISNIANEQAVLLPLMPWCHGCPVLVGTPLTFYH
jgi:hypothetical protein